MNGYYYRASIETQRKIQPKRSFLISPLCMTTTLTPLAFELLVLKLLKPIFPHIHHTGRAGDRGIDFRAKIARWRAQELITQEKSSSVQNIGKMCQAGLLWDNEINIIGQCKLYKKGRITPTMIREIEGTTARENRQTWNETGMREESKADAYHHTLALIATITPKAAEVLQRREMEGIERLDAFIQLKRRSSQHDVVEAVEVDLSPFTPGATNALKTSPFPIGWCLFDFSTADSKDLSLRLIQFNQAANKIFQFPRLQHIGPQPVLRSPPVDSAVSFAA